MSPPPSSPSLALDLVFSFGILHQFLSRETDAGKRLYNVPEFLLSNSVVLSASMLGAIYLFSASLIEMNKKWIKQETCEVVFLTSVKTFNILHK